MTSCMKRIHETRNGKCLLKMVDLGNEFNLKFLEAYKSEPVIWNPMHTHYKDKKKVNDAWLRLSSTLDHPVEALKKKKISLMATFRGHLRRKKASIVSGAVDNDVYKPVWFAYEFMETFLGPIYEHGPTLNTQEMTMPGSPEFSVSSFEEVKEETQRETIARSRSNDAAPIIVRYRKNLTELERSRNRMEEAVDPLNDIISQRIRENEEDECDLFGKMLAKKLRKIPENERNLVMYEIDGIFINRSNRSCSAFPPNSSSNPTYNLISCTTSSVSPASVPIDGGLDRPPSILKYDH